MKGEIVLRIHTWSGGARRRRASRRTAAGKMSRADHAFCAGAEAPPLEWQDATTNTQEFA